VPAQRAGLCQRLCCPSASPAHRASAAYSTVPVQRASECQGSTACQCSRIDFASAALVEVPAQHIVRVVVGRGADTHVCDTCWLDDSSCSLMHVSVLPATLVRAPLGSRPSVHIHSCLTLIHTSRSLWRFLDWLLSLCPPGLGNHCQSVVVRVSAALSALLKPSGSATTYTEEHRALTCAYGHRSRR
jgi:hypothetical protein